MDADLAALELSPTDLVFIPNTHDIYPDTNKNDYSTSTNVKQTLRTNNAKTQIKKITENETTYSVCNPS
jgi:pantothenate synthetase